MNYEVVTIKEKKVEGIKIRTNNLDPKMVENIGLLWQRFTSENGLFKSIKYPTNQCAIGLYDNYEGDAMGDYDATVGCEVNKFGGSSAELCQKIIPAGKYAKFIIKGNVKTALTRFWEEFMDSPIERTFTSDFEEYQPSENMEECEIHIYIAIP